MFVKKPIMKKKIIAPEYSVNVSPALLDQFGHQCEGVEDKNISNLEVGILIDGKLDDKDAVLPDIVKVEGIMIGRLAGGNIYYGRYRDILFDGFSDHDGDIPRAFIDMRKGKLSLIEAKDISLRLHPVDDRNELERGGHVYKLMAPPNPSIHPCEMYNIFDAMNGPQKKVLGIEKEVKYTFKNLSVKMPQ